MKTARDIPAASEFGIEPLPPTVTGVRWLAARSRSSVDAGAATQQLSLDVNGAEAAGTDRSLTSSPVNYVDRFEEDPDTTAALTPTSLVTALLKVERTS